MPTRSACLAKKLGGGGRNSGGGSGKSRAAALEKANGVAGRSRD